MSGSTFLLEDRPARYQLRKTDEEPASSVSEEARGFAEWRAFRKFVFQRLQRYPDILRELVEALRRPEWAVDS